MDLNPTLSLAQATTDNLRSESELLVEACQANDREAQEKLYKNYYGKMYTLCRRYLNNPDDAADMLNRGFFKVFTQMGNFQKGGNLEAWIYAIVRNTVFDHLRSRIRYSEVVQLQETETEYLVDESVHSKLYADDLIKLLDRLPEASKLVFELFAMEGMKHREISEMLNISVNTSKWHVNEARRLLKEMLEKNQ